MLHQRRNTKPDDRLAGKMMKLEPPNTGNSPSNEIVITEDKERTPIRAPVVPVEYFFLVLGGVLF